ncbi:hypothetical protein, variant [Aphanomyces invadans]|uniref:Uncharacterized protein n=1 Tax=Aphanomyces invadans TaxID=157072 RepID=A0A024TGG1_9STRA|nr:hypothetical protein, variant [Aphanomyces invadans]ETV92397.1 hypothetical protein, variant [Aphanomyces invadans]|eukprot:XP_008878948.1 hypothetical protein, variant [Aphanomyces invadans]
MANNSAATVDSTERETLAQECIDLLVQHGYHRASVIEIPIFERVVGGLVFCLQSEALTTVDCDILFRPVATVKERVRVAEAICHSFNTALMSFATATPSTPSMKALTLSVHELQGANYAKLKLVVAWLVQHTQVKLNTRIQQAILTQWNDLGTTSRDSSGQQQRRLHVPWYRVARQSRFRRDMAAKTEQERIQRCLLEYGEKLAEAPSMAASEEARHEDQGPRTLLKDIAKQAMLMQHERGAAVGNSGGDVTTDDFDRLYKTAEQEASAAEQRALQEQQRLQDELLQHAATTHGDQWSHAGVNTQTLQAASLVYGTTSEAIREHLRQQAQGNPGSTAEAFGWLATQRKLSRDREQLIQKARAQEVQLAAAKTALHEVEEATKRLESGEAMSLASFQTLERKQEQLEMREAGVVNSHDLLQLRSLIALHTNLKLQESQFKAACAEQLAELQSRRQALTSQNDVSDAVVQVEQQHERATSKRNELKRAVAKESQAVVAVMRKIDDIPSRSELIQYEKRFAELYDEVALTLDETRKYYSIYNSQETTLEFLDKEVRSSAQGTSVPCRVSSWACLR